MEILLYRHWSMHRRKTDGSCLLYTSKIAVWSNDPDVDAVGACVGMNGARVNAVVEELRGEKIDIINWDENPAILIENALSPAKVIAVMADPDAVSYTHLMGFCSASRL